MGRVRTKTVKRAARQLIEKFYPKMSLDFHYNKRVLDDVAVVPSKRIRNKIAGYASKLMKRIQKGPVRGISLKLQEEERERRMETGAKENFFKVDEYRPDQDTYEMLEKLGLEKIFQ
jgi:small subunit ribosomal protein S17e